MDIKDWIYMAMVIVQLLILARVRQKGRNCGWTRQARWIGTRIIFVTVAVCLLTIVSWNFLFTGGDTILDWMMTVGMINMTILIVFHLPAILDAMTNEKVGEELNIRMNGTEL